MNTLYSLLPARRFLSVLGFIILVNIGATAQISNDDAFNSTDRGHGFGDGPNNAVLDMLNQPDGKVLILGSFTRYSGASRNGIARLKGNNQGLDSSFTVGTGFTGGSGPVEMALQSDGRILVVGSFTQYNGTPVTNIVRLFPNGLIDNSFNVGTGPNPSVNALTAVAVLPGGKILVGGEFLTFSGLPRSLIVRLDQNGTPDPSFDAGAGGAGAGSSLRDLVVNPDGSVLVAGLFKTNFNSTPVSYPQGALLLRLLSTGQADNSFTMVRNTSAVSTGARAIVLTPDGGSIIVGNFQTLWKKASAIGFVTINNFVKLESEGLVDQHFNSHITNNFGITIYDVVAQGTDYVIGGDFVAVGAGGFASETRRRIARINPIDLDVNISTTNIDPAFATGYGANGTIRCLAKDMAGNILCGGSFTRFDQKGRNYVGRISALGNVATPFSINTGADRPVYALAVQPDRKTIIGGEFGYFNWNSTNSIARILPNGQFDPSFNSGLGVNGEVQALKLQADGRILVGGKFDAYGITPIKGLVRVLANGSIDPSFNPGTGTDSTVFAVWVQGNNKILVGGNFTTFSGQPASRLIRLNPDGSVDNTFDVGTGFNGTIRTIAVLRDSLIFVGGDFTSVQGTTRRGIARLQMDGSLDVGFNTGPGISSGGTVYSIGFQKDKKAVVGGFFDDYNGNAIKNVVRMSPTGVFDASFDPGLLAEGPVFDLVIDSTGRIIVVGKFEGKAVGRNGIVRLKTSGAKDPKFGGGDGGDGDIGEIEEDPDGGFLIAGDFTAFDDDARNRIARLNDDEVTVTTWDGGAWDFGIPDDDPANPLHCIIDGDYDITQSGYVCDDLFINAGKLFEPNSDVEVQGNALSNSTLTGGKIVMNSAAAAQSFEGYANDLTIDNTLGVNLNGPTRVKGDLKLQSGTLVTNDALTLVSNASGTARVPKVEAGAGISGEVNVQRYVEGGVAGWHFIGAPVQFPTQTSADWSDDFTIISNSLYLHNEGGMLNSGEQINGWEYFSGNVDIGKGYRAWLNQSFFNGNATFDNQGSLYTGTFPFTVSFTSGAYGGGGWNLLANPYACEIDWDQIYPSQATLVNGEVHVWDQDHYGSYVGGVSVNGGVRYVPSNQGFFVKATAPGAALSVTEDAKPATAQTNDLLRTSSLHPNSSRFTLVGPDGMKDEMVVRTIADATSEFDSPYDAHKLPNPGLNLYTLLTDGTKTSIQATPVQDVEEFVLGYSVPMSGTYGLKIEMGLDMFSGRNWFLKDNEAGTLQSLSQNEVVTIQVNGNSLASDARLRLVGYSTLLNGNQLETPSTPGLVTQRVSEDLHIRNARSLSGLTITDITGRRVLELNPDRQDFLTIRVAALPSGVYHIRLNTKEGSRVEQWIKQ